MKAVAQFLHRFSGGLLLLGMVIAPWLLGSLPPWAIEWILGVLAAGCGCWVLGLIAERRWPVVNFISVVGALLLVQGWLMTAHPVARFDMYPEGPPQNMGRFLPVDGVGQSSFTGSVDGYSSYLGMRSFTLLFVVFHAALDHLCSAKFKRLTLWCTAIVGASVAFLGIEQHFGVRFLLDMQPGFEGAPFGPFGYHGNAGTLLLLALPVAVVLAVEGFLSGRWNLAWMAVLLTILILLGQLFNTARATVAILLGEILILGVHTWRVLPRELLVQRRVLLGVVVAAVASVGVSFFVMPGKWAALPEQFAPHSARRVLWGVVGDFARDAGYFGYGPNTNSVLWPTSERRHELDGLWIYVKHEPGTRMSIWSNAHDDLLQATVEWGWIGAGLWVMMAGGTLWMGVRRLVNRGIGATGKMLLLGPLVALGGVLLHSFVDFPLQILAIQLYVVVMAAFVWARPVEKGAM